MKMKRKSELRIEIHSNFVNILRNENKNKEKQVKEKYTLCGYLFDEFFLQMK